MNRYLILTIIAVLILLSAGITLFHGESKLPVVSPASKGFKERKAYSLDCFLTLEAIQNCITDGDANGLFMDLKNIKELLDGTIVKPTDKFMGSLWLGPYPFESGEVNYTYKRFRMELPVTPNTKKIILPLGGFLEGYRNSEDWSDGGQVVLRMQLFLQSEQGTRNLGLYDTMVSFKKTTDSNGLVQYIKQTTITEDPSVNLITSNDPSSMVITFRTDRSVAAKVVINDNLEFGGTKENKVHEITVTGLEADTEYNYYIAIEEGKTKSYNFRTAPKAGTGEVTFAYCGDSRAGAGDGDYNLMGVNHRTMEKIANMAFKKGAQLFIFGGDLVNGFTNSPDDFRTQLQAWKQAMAGFRHHRPAYSCIGNHEAILRAFSKGRSSFLVLDRWPYETESTEAVFAEQFVNPQNGPVPSDSRRPTYKENVYSFQYGRVRFISFNNNYWVARNLFVREATYRTGGAPEGYMMEDQLEWIQKELDDAEKDRNTKYIVMYAQEPVFPNGGHVTDSMWYKGDNKIRAYTYSESSGKLEPEKEGIIEVRNRLVTMIANNKKVAVVLGSDEHSYHKVLIDKNVPIGVPAIDGMDKVCGEGGTCSPLKDLEYPTWYLVCGGGGAPYYSVEKTPWNSYWQNFSGTMPDHTSKRGCFYYSSQENVFIFKADEAKISLIVYNPYGEVLDSFEDLMKVKSGES
ncbi:MAG: metallophosphoesterase family protein [bacterium]|nr:metallophosphoesterase family protein [bacterium]